AMPSPAQRGTRGLAPPVDLSALLEPAFEQLPVLVGDGTRTLSDEAFDDVVSALLGDAPQSAVDALLDALRDGISLAELGQAVAHAASLRIARFPTSNEFGDWDTV